MVSLGAGAHGRKGGVSRADIEKSRYYYYEALRAVADNQPDAGYECLTRAIELNPANAEAAYMLGQLGMMLDNEDVADTLWMLRAAGMMRDYVDKYPDDTEEGINYAAMITAVDRDMPGHPLLRDTMPESVRVLRRLCRRYPADSRIPAFLSQTYGNLGRYADGVRAIDDYERIEGYNPAITLEKMSMYMAGGDTLGALHEVNARIAANPSDISYRILKGNLYQVMELPDSAERVYREALGIEPESGDVRMGLMDLYRERGDSAAYDDMLYQVLLSEDIDVENKTRMLSQYLSKLVADKSNLGRGDYLFSVLRDQYPHDPQVRSLAAYFRAAGDDYAGAAEEMQYAVDMSRSNPGYRYALIGFLDKAGKKKELVSAILDADSVMSDYTDFRLYGGMLLYRDSCYAESMRILNDVVKKLAPGFDSRKRIDIRRDVPRDITVKDFDALGNAFSVMGDCYMALKDTTNAYNSYENALLIDPDNHLAANNYAYFSVNAGGDLARALRLSDSSLRGEDADNPVYLDTNAWIHFLSGDTARALEIQKRVIELNDKNDSPDAEALEHYGDMLLKNGDNAEAAEAYRRALEIDPGRKDLRDKIEKAGGDKSKSIKK